MKLIVDIGNTLVKIAVYKAGKIIYQDKKTDFSSDDIVKVFSLYKINSTIVSSVRKQSTTEEFFHSSGLNPIFLDHTTPLPILNEYKSPETLGKDRLAAVVGAATMFPNDNSLVIDAGTCITYDFINSKKEYYGGAISPGLETRFKSLNHFTQALPLIEYNGNLVPDFTGDNTENSILSGVINGFTAEISAFIEHYKSEHNSLNIIISGGHYKYFDKLLKYKTFAAPNLVLTGLKAILDFNEQI